MEGKGGKLKESCLLKSKLFLLTFSTLFALAFGRIGLWGIAQVGVINYTVEPGEFVKIRGGRTWPKANFFGTGNRKGTFDNFPIVHDSRGFTFGRIPSSLLEESISGFDAEIQAVLKSRYADILPLFQEGSSDTRRKVLFSVGDSHIRVNFEHLRQFLSPKSLVLSASIGNPGIGPDWYSFAVERWFEPGGQIDRYLKAHPTTVVEVDVYLTLHNDLEDLRGKPNPDGARLVFPDVPNLKESRSANGEDGEALPRSAQTGSSKRDFFRMVASLLLLNKAEVVLLRSALTKVAPELLADARSFSPNINQPEMRRSLAYLDRIEQTLERYAGSGRGLRLNIIVLPSHYDLPSLGHEYTWDDLIDRYVYGDYVPSTRERLVQVRNLRVRELFQAWYPSDDDYITLINTQDLHYTVRAQIDLCIAWALRKGYLPSDWVDEDGQILESRRKWLHEQLTEKHNEIMARIRPLAQTQVW